MSFFQDLKNQLAIGTVQQRRNNIKESLPTAIFERGKSGNQVPKPEPFNFGDYIRDKTSGFRNMIDELISRPNTPPEPYQAPVSPLPDATPRATPISQAGRGSIDYGTLDVGPYQGKSTTPVPLPSREIQNLLWEYFPNEATAAATVLAGENARFDPNAVNRNSDGSIDYGLFQTNNQTIDELLGKPKFGDTLRGYGINNAEDVLGSIIKSIQAASVVRDYESAPRWWGDTTGSAPWSRWYGWQNHGYTIDPNQTVQELAENPDYFQLQHFIRNNPDRFQ